MSDKADNVHAEPELRMTAYYYGFAPTGVREIDRLLSAVACAGKSYHDTDGWTDEATAWEGHEGATPVEWIQNAANDASKQVTSLHSEKEALEQEVSRLRAENEKLTKERDEARHVAGRLHSDVLACIESMMDSADKKTGAILKALAESVEKYEKVVFPITDGEKLNKEILGKLWYAAAERAESAESRLSVAMEIVKELVKLEPTREETPLQWCALCESEAVYFDETIEHKPDCLILRSQALISKEGK